MCPSPSPGRLGGRSNTSLMFGEARCRIGKILSGTRLRRQILSMKARTHGRQWHDIRTGKDSNAAMAQPVSLSVVLPLAILKPPPLSTDDGIALPFLSPEHGLSLQSYARFGGLGWISDTTAMYGVS